MKCSAGVFTRAHRVAPFDEQQAAATAIQVCGTGVRCSLQQLCPHQAAFKSGRDQRKADKKQTFKSKEAIEASDEAFYLQQHQQLGAIDSLLVQQHRTARRRPRCHPLDLTAVELPLEANIPHPNANADPILMISLILPVPLTTDHKKSLL